MTDVEKITWPDAERRAREAARNRFAEAVRYGEDLDAGADYGHEYADGCADVIYTYRARAIWMDSSEVQAWEEEIDGGGVDMTIDRTITLCVYMALQNAFVEEWQTAHEGAEDDVEVVA